ncbi:MAG TPA: acyl-CoA thioesterase domain-containing protein [Burkholderiales bacterium]|nr:acyl-CoA thioesterase domain-containing protein [Burkholderiales bacterium]
MQLAELPDVLRLDEMAAGRYRVRHPREQTEGRDVVFGGQLLAQMIMAADLANGGAKDIKSIHAIFARSGTYTKPIDLVVEQMQSGRTWASHSISAMQDGKLLSRGLVLSSIDDPDLIRHAAAMPKTRPPGAAPARVLAFEGATTTDAGPADPASGAPRDQFWHRYPASFKSVAANQAILSWATNGQLIGLALQPHGDVADISQAHRTISTGVIAHTLNFHERFDVGAWLLVSQEATYAGRGRLHGRGSVFTQQGQLVATFSQDSMARRIEGTLDPKNQM